MIHILIYLSNLNPRDHSRIHNGDSNLNPRDNSGFHTWRPIIHQGDLFILNPETVYALLNTIIKVYSKLYTSLRSSADSAVIQLETNVTQSCQWIPLHKTNILLLACISLRNPLTLPRIPLVLVRIPLSLPRNPLQAVDSTISSWPMQRIPRFCLIVNWNREKLYTAVFVPEFHAANFALCGWHVLKLGPGFHCSNGSTLSCTKSVGLCVVMVRLFLKIF